MQKFIELHQDGELVLFNTAHIIEVFRNKETGYTMLSMVNGICKVDESYINVCLQLTN